MCIERGLSNAPIAYRSRSSNAVTTVLRSLSFSPACFSAASGFSEAMSAEMVETAFSFSATRWDSSHPSLVSHSAKSGSGLSRVSNTPSTLCAHRNTSGGSGELCGTAEPLPATLGTEIWLCAHLRLHCCALAGQQLAKVCTTQLVHTPCRLQQGVERRAERVVVC